MVPKAERTVNISGHVDWSDMQFLTEIKAEINSTPTDTPFGEFIQAPSPPPQPHPVPPLPVAHSLSTNTFFTSEKKISTPTIDTTLQNTQSLDGFNNDNDGDNDDDDFSNPFDDVPFDDDEEEVPVPPNSLQASRMSTNGVYSSAPVLPSKPECPVIQVPKLPPPSSSRSKSHVPKLNISPQHHSFSQQQQQQQQKRHDANGSFSMQGHSSTRVEMHKSNVNSSNVSYGPFVQSARSSTPPNDFFSSGITGFSYTASGSSKLASPPSALTATKASVKSPREATLASPGKQQKSQQKQQQQQQQQIVVMDLIDISGTKKSSNNSSNSTKSGKMLSLNCPNCGFTFFDEKSLSEHMRIHAMDAAATPLSPTTDFLDFLTSPGAQPTSPRKVSGSKTLKPGKSSTHFGLFKKHKTVSASSKSKSAGNANALQVNHASSIESQPMQLIRPVRVLSDLDSIIIVQSLARRWLVKHRTKNECI